jgi:glycosyltransferase involved in cell wall biosynthesis
VGGIPELVVDEQTGILVEPGIPQALSEALIDIFTNETKRQAMGLKSRERVLANYTLEKMVRQTENVFIEAMDDDSYRG